MSRFLQELRYAEESYLKFIKEENARKSMTPKEYGIKLQRKKKKRR